ncbi:transcriptional regulator [Longimycelium tulufanense]|uniref:Transcriptional regulator n=1 Tax=Longimycelium tulufanense TaxID=907463 RepID=A0A8J3FX30_9PSEU|nr:helix-turn-helix transcriptional regulator [Longimycelium tulufanense]GGM58455.1 transcriptional regulator [Longimycelium tulufanense]
MSGSARLRRLGAELRRLREAANLTQAQLARTLGRSQVSLVHWEHGRTRIGKSDLHMLLMELGASEDVRAELEKLRLDGRKKNWWSVFKLPEWLRPLVSFEADAAKIEAFEPILVPGLLQTESYSRVVHIAGPHATPPDKVDDRVKLRIERQRRLEGEDPLRFHAVIAEAALRLEVGGSAVMSEQLWHLVKLASAPNIRIQVLPSSVGAHSALSGNFAVLHFTDPKLDPPLGYADDSVGGHIIDDQADVEVLMSMFGELSRIALSEPESVDFIATVMREYAS